MNAVHRERHFTERIGWLRAAVLGANDGIVSTAALVVGVAAASPERSAVLVAGLAGLVAGARSLAAGAYGSVCAQADPAQYDAVGVINLGVPTASGVPRQLLPRECRGVRVIGIDVPGFGVP
ncbi:MAG: VIT1/CCC1 transporter family protein, partial [Gemmatimonadaceae bacterium]